MSTISNSTTRALVAVQNRLAACHETGASLTEYLVTVLIAVGLVMSVLAIVTGGGLNGVFEELAKKAVTTAANRIG